MRGGRAYASTASNSLAAASGELEQMWSGLTRAQRQVLGQGRYSSDWGVGGDSKQARATVAGIGFSPLFAMRSAAST